MSDEALTAKLNWEAEGIRFSAFPPPSVNFEVRPLWEALTGKPPEEVQERPQLGLRNEFGPFLDDHLFVTQQPARIDIVFGVHPQKNELEMPSVGQYPRVAQAHIEVAGKWLRIAPSLGRIAFAPTLLHRVASVEEGYKRLRELLPRLPLDEGARNMHWQINRPRPSKSVNGVTINRVSKWSLVTLQRMQIAAGTEGLALSQPTTSISACKLELDIYTDPVEPLPAERLGQLLDELIFAAKEISEQGDIS